MPEPRSGPALALPRWVVLSVSAALVFHLFAAVVQVIAAPSGPWSTPFGPLPAQPPPFAQAIANQTTRYYLMPLKMPHNYHFASNRTGGTAAYFEVRLKDEQGKTLETLKFPDDQDNPWVRHREALLAEWLTEDREVQPRAGEVIPAPGQHVTERLIWEMDKEDNALHLKAVPEHLVPRDRLVWSPSEWTLLLARSYSRYLCRTHGAARAQLVRISREPVMPDLLFGDEPPADAFNKLTSIFPEESPR